MEEQENFFGESAKKVDEYLQQRLLLLKLQAAEKTSKLISVLSSAFIILLFGFFIVLFISLMAGYFFAYLTNSLYWGFGIVTLLYIILLVLVLTMKKKLFDAFVVKNIMKIFFDNADENEETGNE